MERRHLHPGSKINYNTNLLLDPTLVIIVYMCYCDNDIVIIVVWSRFGPSTTLWECKCSDGAKNGMLNL